MKKYFPFNGDLGESPSSIYYFFDVIYSQLSRGELANTISLKTSVGDGRKSSKPVACKSFGSNIRKSGS
jgi:hypothetical protein